MIKILIIILILLSIFFLISIIRKNKFLHNLPNQILFTLLVVLFLVFLFFLRIINNNESSGSYVPAKIEGNIIVPGKIEYDK